jgi:general secretion pathway protein I
MPRASGRRDAGFSLIETLVALMVFTACYILVQESISGSWRLVRAAQSEEAALAVAQRQLALSGIETPLEEGSSTGVSDDGYAWAVDIRRYVPPGEQAATPLLAYWVDVSVRWKESALRPERNLSLKTLRLAVNIGAPR